MPDIPVHSIVVDPDDSQRLYLGTDLGVMVSIDGGRTWMTEETGFGPAVTMWLSLIRTPSGRRSSCSRSRTVVAWSVALSESTVDFLQRRESVRPRSCRLADRHAVDVAQLFDRLRLHSRDLAQRGVVEDDVGRHARGGGQSRVEARAGARRGRGRRRPTPRSRRGTALGSRLRSGRFCRASDRSGAAAASFSSAMARPSRSAAPDTRRPTCCSSPCASS